MTLEEDRPPERQAAALPEAGAQTTRPVTSRPTSKGPGWYWTQHPLVRKRVNVLISGSPHTDGYGRLSEFLAEEGRPGRLGLCATLGCGTGGLERDLVRRGLVEEVEGYDASEAALAEARRIAAEMGYDALRYHAAELGSLDLPPARFDAVFAHGALETTEALEGVVAAVHRGLKPGGLFHLVHFVGPSRFQWPDTQLDLVNAFLDTLPDRLRMTPTGLKPPVERPTIAHMLSSQPHVAVRSSEIRTALTRSFDIVEERPYGGNLLHLGLGDIAQNFDPDSAEDVAHLERFFAMEDSALFEGALESDFAVIIATPVPARSSPDEKPRARRPTAFGSPLRRQLRVPPGSTWPGLNLTVSKADTMLRDDAHYLAVGQSALAAIEAALDGATPRAILDLPCGFGRVTRVLRARFPDAAITVSDLDRPGVDFSAQEFDARGAYSVRDFRDLDLGEQFDLIWVGSLMTHLPAEQTRHLLAALGRHLTPDGIVLVTTQGPSIIPRLRETGYGLPPGGADAVMEQYWRTGFGYYDYGGGQDLYGVSLTNANYGISLTDERWMRAAFEESGLELLRYDAQAWDGHQDVAVARLRRTRG